MSINQPRHIRLTSHPEPLAHRWPIQWAAATPLERGPVIGSVTRPGDRNVVGTHGGSYSLYRALAVSAGTLSPLQRPDLANTHPVTPIGPHPQWSEPGKIVSLDPWGAVVGDVFGDAIGEGIALRLGRVRTHRAPCHFDGIEAIVYALVAVAVILILFAVVLGCDLFDDGAHEKLVGFLAIR